MRKTTRTVYMTTLCLMVLGIPNLGRTDVPARHLEYVTHLEQGFMRLFHGDKQGAIAAFEKALEIESNHYELHHYLGMVYADMDFQNKAVAAYHRSLELMPDNIEALYSLAIAYFILGKWAKVAETLQHVIALSPMHPRAYDFLGRAQVKLRQFAVATETLKKAVELNPTAPEIYHELGTAYLNQKKYEEAIPYFQTSIQFNPHYAEPHHGLGTAYLRLGEKEKGRTQMLRFQQLREESAEYYMLSLLTRTEPGNIEGWARLGKLLMRQKNYAEAVPVLEKCIQLAPENASFHQELSQAFINLRQLVLARDAVRNAIRLTPHEANLYNLLAVTYAMQEDIPNAIQVLLKAVEFAPEVPHFHLNLAKLYKRLGQQKLAKEHYQLYEHLKRKTSR